MGAILLILKYQTVVKMNTNTEYQDQELQCKGCMSPCGQCEDEDFYGYEDDCDEDFDDDVCCWDIRYKCPEGYCHCKAYAYEEVRQARWGWILRPIKNIKAIPFRVSNWWWKFKRNNFPISIECDNCSHKYWFVGNEPKCPQCGNYNLPF